MSAPAALQDTKSITYAQRHFMDKIAGGWNPGGNTSRTGAALEKRGLVEFEYRGRTFCGAWKFTDEGQRVYTEMLGGRARLIA